jgi:hypothetical protein
MASHQDDTLASRLRDAYLQTPPPDPAAKDRLLQAARALPPPRRRRGLMDWLLLPVEIRLRPVTGLAVAVILLVAGAWGWHLATERGGATRSVHARGPQGAPGLPTAAPTGTRVVAFVLVSPEAQSVALVGDFNGWDAVATPMHRAEGGRSWVAVVPLEFGRHAYAFVVDGKHWVNDPAASLAPDNGFGGRNSVIVVGAGST